MSNNNTYKRPVIVWGNSFYINISLERYIEGTYKDFDLTKVTDLKVYLICATHNTEIPLTYEIVDGFNNVIKCFVDYRLLHTTSYGIVVEGNDEKEMHFRFSMLPKEGFLVVNNTSGMNITDDVQVIDISGRCGWGISAGTDLTNYYTKITIDNLLNEKADKSSLAKVATSGDYNDLVNKPVVKEQVQSDWNENDKTKPDYIKNKPDLSQYIKEQDLNNYYDKGEVDVMLNNKVDTSTLNSDYYNKNTVNNLLAEKVDTSDLSQVAISGDYNELNNKPDLSQYATKEEVNSKQDTLISGSNIKTINNQSLLGSGNIDIQGGGSGGVSYTAGKNIDIADNVISTTNDLDVTTIKTEDIKIKKAESGTVHYIRFHYTPDMYLAEQAMYWNELRAGDKWYTFTKSWLKIDTQNHGLIVVSYDEWTYTEDIPSWITGYFTYPFYKSTSLVNGHPVYGTYDPETASPNFFIYDADNYGINSIYVEYNDITLYQPISYWRIKDKGMFINKENDYTNNSFAAERQVSIGENNKGGNGENKLMIGHDLEGEFRGNQLLVGYHNSETDALFTVGNGESSTSFYPYEKTINNNHSFTIWTTLNYKAFTDNSGWHFGVDIRNSDDTQLFRIEPSVISLNEIASYPYSYNIVEPNLVDWTTYYETLTLQRDNNNLGITVDIYTDEQHTSTYNIFDSLSKFADDVFLNFNFPYKRDAFFVSHDGNVFIPYFQDRNNTYNLGEAIYNLEQRPQPVQSNWNEGDESSLAYIQNKPDLNQYATKEEVNAKQDTLISGSNIKTINGQDILGSGDIVISSGEKPYEEQYLTFEALEDGTFSFTQNDLQYSLDDGNTWQTLTAGTSTPTISAGNKILWKQTGLTPDKSTDGIGVFSSTKKFNVYGNIMSLYYGDDFIGQKDLTGKDYAFYELFSGCGNLISAENLILPATILANSCYKLMFQRCYSLITTPELPATTLTNECYFDMFNDCTSLTKAPELPATTLAYDCYYGMFVNCSSLKTAPELPATTLAEGCYYAMFQYCTSLTKAPELPATTLVDDCYSWMFSQCYSLTEAPDLPATTLAYFCYQSMFNDCTSLSKAPELPATTLEYKCYSNMFKGCSSLTEAPDLPATTLAQGCYNEMFYGCQKLRYVKCLATDISATDCLTNWLDGTMLLGTFITAENKPAYESGTSGIPSGWNVYTESQYEEVRHYELANVATTGDYNDLINKPNISEAGFIKVNNDSNIGLVNSLSSYYDKLIGRKAVIEGDGYIAGDGSSSVLIKASGDYSHAEGCATIAKASYSHAEGYDSLASGIASHAEGYNSLAAGQYSHTEGRDTYATGNYSHAEGGATRAQADYSHAEGFSTEAKNNSEHSSGRYNVSNKNNTNFGDSGNTLLSVGNGSSATKIHNAFEIRQNGDIYYSDTKKIDGSTVYYYNAPMKKLQDAMVTSESTNGLKIEVVNALPETPAENTIYIVL